MHVHIPGSGKPKKKQSDVKKLVKLMTSNALMKKIAYEMCASYVKPELFSGVTTLRSVGGIQDLDAKLRDEINSRQARRPAHPRRKHGRLRPGGHMAGSLPMKRPPLRKLPSMCARLPRRSPTL